MIDVTNTLALIGKYYAVLNTLIAIADDVLPDGGKGQQKLDQVKAALKTIEVTAGMAEGVFEQVWPTLQPLVAMIVALKKHKA